MRLRNDFVTPERVRELLSYSPDAGEFVWTELAYSRFRGRRAGCHKFGYRVIRIDGTAYFAHRLAWLHVFGRWPGDVLDHVNGDKADNRICNLREATPGQNAVNSKARASASGIKGVYRAAKAVGKWRAEFRANGKFYFLGEFWTKDEAARVYAEAFRSVHGEFARIT